MVVLDNQSLVEKELEFYKKMVSKLNIGIDYQDKELGISYLKEANNEESVLFHLDTINEDRFEIDFNAEENVPCEMIEKLLLPIIDTIPHHLTFLDENGIITLVNKQVCKDYKKPRHKILGRHIRELLNIPDDQITLIETINTQKEIVDREVLDKNYGILNTKIISLNGGTKRYVGTFQFLNAIKEAERKGIAGRIAAGIAHEIRNPLTVVKGFLQIMGVRVNEDGQQLIDEVLLPEIDRANAIITDFLAIAKTAPAKNDIVAVNDFIGGDLFKLVQGEVFLHNISLSLDLKDELKDDKIVINKDEMTQVFLNLFKNAEEASINPLSIDITTRKRDDRVKVIFKDNGPGISPSNIDAIFDPFFTTKDEGTGLGLSVSRKIIENHGGKMKVISNSNGTTFIIELPLLTQEG